MRKLAQLALVVLIAGLTLEVRAANPGPQPVFEVRNPTVVAFFVEDAQSEIGSDESAADFKRYAARVAEPLRKLGIEFRQTYASSFCVRIDDTSVVFRPKEIKAGYYLIAPGKKARIEYGVLTDHDLLQIARQYFGIKE